MNDDVYKNAVLRVLPAAPEIPLDAPPVEMFDMDMALTCPACGGMDAAVQEVEDAEVAKCPCGCEFPPRMESVSRKVIRGIAERRQRRFVRFMERLPVQSPVVNLDQTDYDLFRKIVDGSAIVKRPVPGRSPHNLKKGLNDIKERFVRERVQGFVHHDTGEHIAPVTRAEALRRWEQVKGRFTRVLKTPDEDVATRLNLPFEREEFEYTP